MDLRIIDFPEYPWKTLNVHKDFNYSYNISPGKKIEGDLFDSSKMKVVSYNENSRVQILAVCDPNEIAEEKFLRYVKESGIKLSYEVNGIPYMFHRNLLSELNYDERGYPESVSEEVKHAIADDITNVLEDKFKGLKDEALNYALSEFNKQKHSLEVTAKIWKHFALIFIITTIVLTIRLFIQLLPKNL